MIIVFCICVTLLNLLQFAGIKSFIVRSGSMEPAIWTGSLCFVNTHCEYEDIVSGDVIAYKSGKALVTHRVIDVTDDGFITKGDNNTFHDGLSTTKDNYIGRNIGAIPLCGYIVSWLQMPVVRIMGVTFLISFILIQFMIKAE